MLRNPYSIKKRTGLRKRSLKVNAEAEVEEPKTSNVKKETDRKDEIVNTKSKSNKKPDEYSCQHCGKLYKWKSTMRRHERVECGGKEPTFQCDICPYKAKQKGNLRVHAKKHHP